MNIIAVFSIILLVGIVILIIGAVLMLLSPIIAFVCRSGRWKGRMDTVLYISTCIVELGLLMFLLTLAGSSLFIVIEAMIKGTYRLSFSRTGGEITILWENQPVWFAFQTVIFIGFSVFLIFLSIKRVRSLKCMREDWKL